MATFNEGASGVVVPAISAQEPSGTVEAPPGPPPAFPFLAGDRIVGATASLTINTDNKGTGAQLEHDCVAVPQAAGTFDWFEDFHVLARAYDFGNLLSDAQAPLEVFSAFRRSTNEWTSFVNGAGAGTTVSGLPSLPTNVEPLSGVQMTLEVSTTGQAIVDDTLDFEFSGVGTVEVPIKIQRIVLWGIEPESDHDEVLQFLSQRFRSQDGTDKVHSLRKNPRQRFEHDYLIEDDRAARLLHSALFDFHALTFGVPVWREESRLTVAAAAGATTITVDSTDWRDYRIGGLAVILVDQLEFDVVQVAALTTTTIDAETPIVNAYPAGTRVFPLRPCRAPSRISGSRWPVNLSRLGVAFDVTDNDVDLADLTPFSSFEGALLMDLDNSLVGGTLSEGFEIQLDRIDGLVGLVQQDSSWDRNRRSYVLTVRAEGLQALWELRGMVHALRGPQVSFYVPTGEDDLEVVADLLNMTFTMDVEHLGYDQFVRARQPRDVVRVTTASGSTHVRRIVGSEVVSPDVERLTLATSWTSTIAVADVARVEYVERLRIQSDDVRLRHRASADVSYLVAPVEAALE